MKLKPEEELVLRAFRWAWWSQFHSNGAMYGVSADTVFRALQLAKVVPDAWRVAADPVGRVHYRMKKLVNDGWITNGSSWGNRYTQYQPTSKLDYEAAAMPGIIQRATADFNARMQSEVATLQQLATQILPGNFTITGQPLRQAKAKPEDWTINIVVTSPITIFRYFMNLAASELRRQESIDEEPPF